MIDVKDWPDADLEFEICDRSRDLLYNRSEAKFAEIKPYIEEWDRRYQERNPMYDERGNYKGN